MSQLIYCLAGTEFIALVALTIAARRIHAPVALALSVAFMLFLWVWGTLLFIDCYLITQAQHGDWSPLAITAITAFHGLIASVLRKARERRARV